MALTLYSSASGTITPGAINTPQNVLGGTTVTTTLGIYAFEVDFSNMLSGDTLIIYIQSATISGQTFTVGDGTCIAQGSWFTVTGAPPAAGQGERKLVAQALVGFTGAFILNQTAGTARAYPYSVWLL